MVGVRCPYGSLLETLLSSAPVGQIRYNRHGRISFAFEPAYLKQERPPVLSLSLLSDDGSVQPTQRKSARQRSVRISELARIIGSIHPQQPDYTLFLLPSCATNGVHLSMRSFLVVLSPASLQFLLCIRQIVEPVHIQTFVP